jgi:hypothetical protein
MQLKGYGVCNNHSFVIDNMLILKITVQSGPNMSTQTLRTRFVYLADSVLYSFSLNQNFKNKRGQYLYMCMYASIRINH